jgi:hypothetical protein
MITPDNTTATKVNATAPAGTAQTPTGIFASLVGLLKDLTTGIPSWARTTLSFLIAIVIVVIALHATVTPTFITCRLMLQEKANVSYKSFGKNYVILTEDGEYVTNANGVWIAPVRGFWPHTINFQILDKKSKDRPRVLAEFEVMEPIPFVTALRSQRIVTLHTYRKDSIVEITSAHDQGSVLGSQLQWTQASHKIYQGAEPGPLLTIVHLADLGDIACQDDAWCGTKGEGRRLEGFTLTQTSPIPGVRLQYQAHLSDSGDTEWVDEGVFCGTRGQSRSVEGIAVRLFGPASESYTVLYHVHMSRLGDSNLFRDGEYAGTKGQARGIEALHVWIKNR